MVESWFLVLGSESSPYPCHSIFLKNILDLDTPCCLKESISAFEAEVPSEKVKKMGRSVEQALPASACTHD
jgi:hypothetical protein